MDFYTSERKRLVEENIKLRKAIWKQTTEWEKARVLFLLREDPSPEQKADVSVENISFEAYF